MRYRVDLGKCTGNGRCVYEGPDLYSLDDLGYNQHSEGEIPAALESQARRGAAACPEQAISLED